MYNAYKALLRSPPTRLCQKCLMKSKAKPDKEQKRYTDTINLPKTAFPLRLRGNAIVERDEKILKERGFASLYAWQRNHINGPEYILHDGPPYANGVPHMGHAINKILKDITTRHKLLQGHKVHYKPGWDCHGLPIELKAIAGVDISKMTPVQIRTKARKFAKEVIQSQKAVFKYWGVMADWEDGCYFTFSKPYIQNQLQQFYSLYQKGLIYRDLKPVYWSPMSRTALAEAELEYSNDHRSLAATISIPLTTVPDDWRCEGHQVYALVWTTTPWTLPANKAIAYSSTLDYALISISGSKERYLIAVNLLDEFSKSINKWVDVVKTFSGGTLNQIQYQHPITGTAGLPFIPGTHVTASKGTGLVHIAPAHGPDDFLLGKQYGLLVDSLVDENGCYTADAGPSLVGLSVLSDGSDSVLAHLSSTGVLLKAEEYVHSYPYDWRTKTPVIVRASQQWFFDTDAIKDKALEVLKDVNLVPDVYKTRLATQLENRPYWCISRQRVWGVPIPVLYDINSGQPVISQSLIEHYSELLGTVGDDFWWKCNIQELVPDKIRAELGVEIDNLQKGQDILDIWFDSGVSWSSVLDNVADLYLEGIDQFTGWFQSSLLASVALQGVSPYRTIFVHGFAVDEDGRKMSKSLGNVVNPQDITIGGMQKKKQPPYGVDVLRWWVAHHATQHTQVPVSTKVLEDSAESVQKVRSILRFLVASLCDLTSIEHLQPNLQVLDRYLLHLLWNLNSEVVELYSRFQYNHVCSKLINFITNQVSGLYCHVIKDRLYCESEFYEGRRAVQLTNYNIIENILHHVAPILPLLAEEIYMYHPLKTGNELFFQNTKQIVNDEWNRPDIAELMKLALDIRQRVNKLCPINCNSRELSAKIVASPAAWNELQVLQNEECSSSSELAEILQVSTVHLTRTGDAQSLFEVEISKAAGYFCDRCRRYTAASHGQLCSRCSDVLTTKLSASS